MKLLRLSSLLLVISALWAAPVVLAQMEDELEMPAGMSEPAEDDGPPSTLTLAKFKEAVAKVQMAGFHRMPEMSEDGDHQLILVSPPERAFYVMAQRAGIGAKLEKGAAGKLSRFTHDGHEAFFAQLKDEEGETTSFILVKYPEHNMGLFLSAKPAVRRAELMKLLGQVAF